MKLEVVVSGDIIFDPILLNTVNKYKDSNRLLFGINSNRQHYSQIVKKLLLILISAWIMVHSVTVLPPNKDKIDYISVSIKAVLTISKYKNTEMIYMYALFGELMI